MNVEEMNQVEVEENPVEIKAPENVLLGLLGAVIGAIIGGVSIVLLNRLGYIASISGVILAFCTLKGYELLAKGLSKKGIVICIILMVLTPFIADTIDWVFVIMETWAEYNVTFAEALFAFPELLTDGSIDLVEYFKNLGMIYLFVILGGFYTAKKMIKK